MPALESSFPKANSRQGLNHSATSSLDRSLAYDFTTTTRSVICLVKVEKFRELKKDLKHIEC